MTEWKLLVLINVISYGAIAHQIYYTLHEFTTILDINVFSAKYPHKLKKRDEQK